MAVCLVPSREAGEGWGRVGRTRTRWDLGGREPILAHLSPISSLGPWSLWRAGGIWLLG